MFAKDVQTTVDLVESQMRARGLHPLTTASPDGPNTEQDGGAVVRAEGYGRWVEAIVQPYSTTRLRYGQLLSGAPEVEFAGLEGLGELLDRLVK